MRHKLTAGKPTSKYANAHHKPFEHPITAWGVGLAAVVAVIYLFQLRTMQTSLHIDQRAWVSVTPGEPNLKVGEPIIFPATFLNTGKTAARKLEGYAFVTTLRSDDMSFNFGPYTEGNWPRFRAAITSGLLIPNSPMPFPLPIQKSASSGGVVQAAVLSEELKRDIDGQQTILVEYGQVTYEDVFGTKHWLHFCAGYGSMMADAGKKCTSYNDTDDD